MGVLRLGIVTGLVAEARIAAALGDAEPGGGRPDGADAAAERLVARGAQALLSFGLAGGLDPALAAGRVMVPEYVLEAGAVYPTDPGLTAWLGGPTVRLLLAGDAVVADVAAKSELFVGTGASAVDLESGAVARVAGRHGLKFAVLRAICDPGSRSLPPAALVALDGGGAIGLLRVLGSLARRPSQLGQLLAVGRDAAAAQLALRQLVGRIAPFLPVS